jgi:hypothetical protein
MQKRLLQQRVEEKRLFLTRRGGGIAVRVEAGPRNGVLRRQRRTGGVRGPRSRWRPTQGSNGLNAGRPRRQFQGAISEPAGAPPDLLVEQPLQRYRPVFPGPSGAK